MVVVLLSVTIDPVVGADLRLNDELIAFARMLGNGLAQAVEGDEIEAGHRLASVPLLIFAGVVVADEADLRVGGFALGQKLWVFSEIAHGGNGETIHANSFKCVAAAEIPSRDSSLSGAKKNFTPQNRGDRREIGGRPSRAELGLRRVPHFAE